MSDLEPYTPRHRREPELVPIPSAQHEEALYVFVPWECPSCGRKAQARRDYVIRCVCGRRSPSTPGAVL